MFNLPTLRIALISSLLSTSLALSACGGPPEGARTAQRHLKSGNYDAAEAAADKTLLGHPRDPTSWRVKIQSAMGRGSLADAVALYEEWKELRGGHDATAYRLMAMTTLWQAMRVPSADTKTRAIRIVERHEIEKLADAVREQLGSEDDLVAAAAAVALLTSHPAAPRLAVELLRSDNERARAIAVTGIGRKVGRVARQDIFPALRDSSPMVRRAAVDAIGRWNNKKDRSQLVQLVHADKDGQVRSRALRALMKMGGEDLIAIARTSIKDQYLGARIAAVGILDKHGGQAVIDELGAIAASADLAVALRASVALYKRDQRDMQPVLLRALASPDWVTRSAALNAAADATDKTAALSIASKGMADERLEVRLTAARVLLRLGDEEPALAAMREALGADSLPPRLLAATDLARRGEPEAIALLSTMATAGPSDRREAAILAHRSAGVVSDGLVQALGDTSISVRIAAADVLLKKN